jgi:hypothetical protein
MCFTVACCNSIVFFKCVSADRNGMAAARCLERYLVSSSVLRLYCVLQVILGRSHWNCYITHAISMLGFARNIVFFAGKRRFRCGEKLARTRDGRRRRRFAVESCSKSARNVTEDFFSGRCTKGLLVNWRWTFGISTSFCLTGNWWPRSAEQIQWRLQLLTWLKATHIAHTHTHVLTLTCSF